jgi:hypothetical protein
LLVPKEFWFIWEVASIDFRSVHIIKLFHRIKEMVMVSAILDSVFRLAHMWVSIWEVRHMIWNCQEITEIWTVAITRGCASFASHWPTLPVRTDNLWMNGRQRDRNSGWFLGNCRNSNIPSDGSVISSACSALMETGENACRTAIDLSLRPSMTKPLEEAIGASKVPQKKPNQKSLQDSEPPLDWSVTVHLKTTGNCTKLQWILSSILQVSIPLRHQQLALPDDRFRGSSPCTHPPPPMKWHDAQCRPYVGMRVRQSELIRLWQYLAFAVQSP